MQQRRKSRSKSRQNAYGRPHSRVSRASNSRTYTSRKMSLFRKQSTQANTRKTSINEPVVVPKKKQKLSKRSSQVKIVKNSVEEPYQQQNESTRLDPIMIKEQKHCMFSDQQQMEELDDDFMYSPLKCNQSNASSYHRKKKYEVEEYNNRHEYSRHEY